MTHKHFTLKSLGIRPMGAIRSRRHFQRKMAWITDEFHPFGVLADVTPAPGCHYTRATWPPRNRGRGESLYSPRRNEAKERAYEAYLLWQDGYTWQAVADTLGFAGRSGAWHAVRRMIDRQDYEAWKKEDLRKYS